MEIRFPLLQRSFSVCPANDSSIFALGRLSSFVLITSMSIACFAAPAGLAAQRTGAGTAAAAVFADSTPDAAADAQAPAAPSQSTSANTPAAQNQSAQGQPAQSTDEDSGAKQTKRILGIVPNFRAVSADEKLPRQNFKEKFMDATEDSFDYSSVFFPAVIAGYNQAKNATPEFHQGAAGYARYFWHSAVDQTSENYMVEFIFPTVTREDSRYYTLGHGGFWKRTGYALSRAVVTRTDSGKETFNISEVVGAGAAAGLSNLYYPRSSRGLGSTGSQWGLDVGIDSGVFVFREFWPDINRRVFHNKYSDAPAH
jgi:hypothetical protein